MARTDHRRQRRFVLGALLLCGIGLTAFMLTPGKLSMVDYIRWMEDPDNGLRAGAGQGPIGYELQFKTPEYMALREYGARSTEEVREHLDKIATDVDLYTLKITGANASEPMREQMSSEADYYERVAYYALEFQNDLFIVQGSDTLDCLFAHTERTYGVSPHLRVILAMEALDRHGPMATLVVQDRALGEETTIAIDPAKRLAIPALQLDRP